MMRTIVAILAISPALLHAQVKSPAQPSSTPVLQSSLLQPAAFTSGSAATTPTPTRISSGVVPPKLIYSVDLVSSPVFRAAHAGSFEENRTVVIGMTIDETGKPTNLKVLQSADRMLGREVLDAVSQFRYAPATLNGVSVPIIYNLTYTIEHQPAE